MLENAVMSFRVTQNAGELSSGYWSSAQRHRVSLVSACVRLIKYC
jgi:hypothetical protein